MSLRSPGLDRYVDRLRRDKSHCPTCLSVVCQLTPTRKVDCSVCLLRILIHNRHALLFSLSWPVFQTTTSSATGQTRNRKNTRDQIGTFTPVPSPPDAPFALYRCFFISWISAFTLSKSAAFFTSAACAACVFDYKSNIFQ